MTTKKKSEDPDELLSVTQAAKERGVRHGAIVDLLDRGRLPHQIIGGRRFIRRGDLKAFEPEKGGRGRKIGSA